MPDAPARECYHVKAGGQETSSEVEVTCKVVVLQTYKGNTQRGIILIHPHNAQRFEVRNFTHYQ